MNLLRASVKSNCFYRLFYNYHRAPIKMHQQQTVVERAPQAMPVMEREGQSVTVHGTALNSFQSSNYLVEIDDQPALLHFISGYAGGDVSWVSFDFSKPVKISVTALRNVSKVDICPLSKDVHSELSGNTVTFYLSEPGQFFLKWDDSFELPFHVFANRREVLLLTQGEDRVHYFGPGLHYPGVIRLGDGETLYIAAGAVVYGVVEAIATKNVQIRGRGILCGSHLDRKSKETYEVGDQAHELICLRNSSDVVIEGITILDSHHWTVTLWNCDRIHIDNIKIINERHFSTDGINPVNSRDVLIENCFARCKDDCISIKGLDEKHPENAAPINNITVQRCVFWSDNNNGMVVGSETQAKTIKNIVFRDIDLLKTSNTCGDYAGAMSIICLHDTHISHIKFENIRIEHSSGPYFNFFFTNSIFRIPGQRLPVGGIIQHIELTNITVLGGPLRASYITGMDSIRRFTDITIKNLRIHGKHISCFQEGRISVNPFVENVRLLK